MRVAHIASEVAPWSQTGGLADVLGSLPGALERVGRAAGVRVQAAVFAPLYRGVRERAAAMGARLEDSGVRVDVALAGRHTRVGFVTLRHKGAPPVHLLDFPPFFDRDGLYVGPDGRDHGDNHLRFALLCAAAIEASPELMGGAPDMLHAHDWQGALVPVYARARYGLGVPCVFTIHNLAYQGMFSGGVLGDLGLDPHVMSSDRMEYYGAINLLKGGVAYADCITTVSPTYAKEILSPQLGVGLDGFLRRHTGRLIGILNGVDTDSWDPTSDPAIAARYDDHAIDGKRACRSALAQEFGLRVDDGELLLGVVSRFVGQKGLDLVADMVPRLHAIGAKLVVLGSGARDLEDRFRYLAHIFSHHIALRIGFDVAASRRIYSGVDALLVPSRFEPCGLSQMYAMRYGAVPIVHAVGGLRDTVLDPGDAALCRGEGTGFRFDHPTVIGLDWATCRAAGIFARDRAGWLSIARAGMRRDWSWDRSARAFLDIYRRLTG